jgi:selenocysteine lyase/cysteine desulfurase
MEIDRRSLLQSLLLGPIALGGSAAVSAKPIARSGEGTLSAAADFPDMQEIYFESAGGHPLVRSAVEVMRLHIERRALRSAHSAWDSPDPLRRNFARLINADMNDLAIVDGTVTGEFLVVRGMDLQHRKGNVVTDALHHDGSLYMYLSLASDDLEVRIVKPDSDGKMPVEKIVAAIDGNTLLVATSLVAQLNGYVQDLKTICDAAHQHGAHVYADIVQAVGQVPVDVKETGVDFCCASTYKWLMGDIGVGLFYSRPELRGTVVKRSRWGHEQYTLENLWYHGVFPFDEPGKQVLTWRTRPDAEGFFGGGGAAYGAVRASEASTAYVIRLGIERIREHAQPLVDRLQEELPKLGYRPMTPRGNQSSIASFIVPDPESLKKRLQAARITTRIWHHQMRISPSVFNTDAQVTALIEQLRDHVA